MVICTSAIGETYHSMLKIMAPTVKYYANKHNIDYFINGQTSRFDSSRPPSWDKLILMRHLLKYYKTVMWIDADAIICNPNHDIRKDINHDFPMQLVTHFGIKPLFPNCGIWLIQQDPRSFELLEEIWAQTNFINHPWWEQGALLKLLGYKAGYTGKRKVHFYGPTKYSSWVGPLDLKWNSRPTESDVAENPAIMHFVFVPLHIRIKKMKKQYKNFLNVIQVSEFVKKLNSKHLKNKKPSIVLFKRTQKSLKPIKFIYKNELDYLSMIKKQLRNKQLTGVIILNDFAHRDYAISYLKKRGLKINRNLFILDSH